jgi:hypothetical protein
MRHQMPPDESPGPGDKNVTFRMCGFAHKLVLEMTTIALKASLADPYDPNSRSPTQGGALHH